jgi:hypothetical protein
MGWKGHCKKKIFVNDVEETLKKYSKELGKAQLV